MTNSSCDFNTATMRLQKALRLCYDNDSMFSITFTGDVIPLTPIVLMPNSTAHYTYILQPIPLLILVSNAHSTAHSNGHSTVHSIVHSIFSPLQCPIYTSSILLFYSICSHSTAYFTSILLLHIVHMILH